MPNYEHQAMMAAKKLKEFNWALERGIRLKDVNIFKEAASLYDHIIIVRATNPRSIRYIGNKNYTPKAIDCKPKTADICGFVFGKIIRCSGLVVNPTLLPNTFKTADKYYDAIACWKKFVGITPPASVIRRRGKPGYYIVDTYKNSPQYGCLMVSNRNPPSENFTLETEENWLRKDFLHLKYIHGDYDLYGLIDMSKMKSGYKNPSQKEIHKKNVGGITNYFSPHFHEISLFINQSLGTKMVQHGSQDTVSHKADKLYVFTPLKIAYVMEGTAHEIMAMYKLLFKEQPI